MLATIVVESAKQDPTRLSLVGPGRRLSRAEVSAGIRSVAQWLVDHGLEPGGRVGICAKNSVDWAVVSLGIAYAGGSAIPMSYRATDADIEHLVRDSGSTAVFCDSTTLSVVEAAAARCEDLRFVIQMDDQSVSAAAGVVSLEAVLAAEPLATPIAGGTSMTYTAGTTGPPKGVSRDQAAGLPEMLLLLERFGLRPDDIHLVAGPMYHTGPNGWANIALGLGNTVVILESFDPEDLLRQVEREQVTTTFMVPTMLRMLTKHPAATLGLVDTSSLRVLVSAGEPCPMPLKRDVADRFGPVLYEFGGASELGVLSVIGPEEHEKRPGSCGQLIDPDAVTIRDDDGVCVPPGVEGVIWVKSATLASYWNRPDDTAEATSSDGAMTVWDLGYVDDDGYLYITGRSVDVIKTGGVKVTPTEIESVLLEHPSVVEASVVGMPDAEWGERVVACYRAATDQPVDPDELDAWCRDRLARPMVPKEYVYMSAARWPRQETGKVPKRLLRELLGGFDAMPTARSDKS